MNNNNNKTKDERILDWILDSDNNERNCKQLSSDLIDYLFDQNVNTPSFIQQPQQQQLQLPQVQSQPGPSTTQQGLPQNSKPADQGTSRNRSNANSSPSDEDEDPTEAQLKMMPSKERRQLRNKISARNFRNRRKEYMASLEAQMEQCKAENSQLKLEVKWVRDMMDKLQAENDRLRLELVLCKQKHQQQLSPTADPLKDMNASIPPAVNNYDGYGATSNSISPSPPTNNLQMMANSEFLSSVPTTTSTCNQWDFNYAAVTTVPQTATCTNTPSNSSTTNTNTTTSATTLNSASLPPSAYNNIYLAHASLPNWDMSCIFEKDGQSITPALRIDLIRAYPLLAPALMSIVLNQTLAMTTEEIMANSTLCDPTTPNTLDTVTNKCLLAPLSDSVVPRVQEQQQQEQQLQERAQQPVVGTPETNSAASRNSNTEQAHQAKSKKDNCPINWVQRQFCIFVIHYVVVKYPRLDTTARKYLPICDKYRKKAPITQLA